MCTAGAGRGSVVRVAFLGWGYRYQVPHATALAMRGSWPRPPPRSMHWMSGSVRFGRWTTSEAWPGHGSRPPGRRQRGDQYYVAAAETATAKGQFAAEVMLLQTATSSVIVRRRPA